MERYKKASFYSVVTFLVVSIIANALEYKYIYADRTLYLAGKIVLHLWMLRVCFLIRKDAFKVSHNLEVGSLMMIYAVHGQYFNPWYMFVYHELIIGFSFLFPLPKRIFMIFAAISCLCYLAMMLWRFDNLYTWFSANSRIDWTIAGIAITVVAVLSHTFFTSDRNQRDALMKKFGLIGFQTATVVHDVKSMLASPRMNVDLLKKKISTSLLAEDSQVQELLQTLEAQIANISKSMTALNQVVALQQSGRESLQLSQIIHEVSALLSLSNRNITLEVTGDGEVFSEKSLLKSILFNVLMNSIQAFRKNPSTTPKIQIRHFSNHSAFTQVEIVDNAGGYPVEVLNSLSSNKTDHLNAGMGLFLILTGMQSLGGSAEFANDGPGAIVKLNFQKQNLRSRFRFGRSVGMS